MSDRLGHKQTAAMFALLVAAREVSNPELETLVGFRLSGQDCEDLKKRGFVASRKHKRTLHHALTEDGRDWCRSELKSQTVPPPHARSVLAPALYVVLGGLDKYLRQENLALTDVFPIDVEVTAAEIERRIRTAYRRMVHPRDEWVRLAELRPMLGKAAAKDVDAVLKELSRAGRINLEPEPNQKMLTEADHRAAIHIGGVENHLISIEGSA